MFDDIKKRFLAGLNPLDVRNMPPGMKGAVGLWNTEVQTAEKNNWTPGGFAGNVAKGAGDLVSGIASLPETVWHAATNPSDAGPIATQFIKSLGSSVNNTLGQPINPQTGKFQPMDVSKAMQYAYEKPIDVASNALVGAGAIAKGAEAAGMAGKAGQAAEAAKAAETAADVGKAGWTSEGMKMQGMPPIGQGLVSATKQGLADTAGVSDVAANTYLKAFSVRRELGKNMDMPGVAKQMINDGITGDIPTIESKVQNILDATEEMKRNALSNLQGGVDIS